MRKFSYILAESEDLDPDYMLDPAMLDHRAAMKVKAEWHDILQRDKARAQGEAAFARAQGVARWIPQKQYHAVDLETESDYVHALAHAAELIAKYQGEVKEVKERIKARTKIRAGSTEIRGLENEVTELKNMTDKVRGWRDDIKRSFTSAKTRFKKQGNLFDSPAPKISRTRQPGKAAAPVPDVAPHYISQLKTNMHDNAAFDAVSHKLSTDKAVSPTSLYGIASAFLGYSPTKKTRPVLLRMIQDHQALDARQNARMNAIHPLPPAPDKKPAYSGWYGSLAPDKQQSLFAIMRELGETAETYHTKARNLMAPRGTVSVGGADFDYTLKAEVINSFLRALRIGDTPAEALAVAKSDMALVVKSFNARRGDYVTSRSESSEQTMLNGIYHRVLLATGSGTAPHAHTKPDQAVVNVPLAKRGDIDKQLDKHKADQAKQLKADTKTRAAETRDDKARARELYNLYGAQIAAKFAANHPGSTTASIMKTLDSLVKWEPKKMIQIGDQHLKENPHLADTKKELTDPVAPVDNTSVKPTGAPTMAKAPKEPQVIRTFSAAHITILPTTAGVDVVFPYNTEMSDSLKKLFAKARWNSVTKRWNVPGVKSYDKAREWATEMDAQAKTHAITQTTALAGVKEHVHACRAELTGIPGFILGNSGVTFYYAFAYDDAAVSIARTMPGAKWDAAAKRWMWRAETIPQADAIIAGVKKIHAHFVAKKQHAAHTLEPAKPVAQSKPKFIERTSRAPAKGAVIRRGGKIVRITDHGKSWRGDDDLSSMGGPIGAEGEQVCYVYYEPATPAEEEKFLEAEHAKESAQQRHRERAAAIAQVRGSHDAPHVGHVPHGEVIWKDEKSIATGYGEKIIHTPDGWLWHVVYDGTDGGAWGDYNLGYNTHGARLKATPELIASIKA
jgi:hypothetical protein